MRFLKLKRRNKKSQVYNSGFSYFVFCRLWFKHLEKKLCFLLSLSKKV
jgi:hypothetical protein